MTFVRSLILALAASTLASTSPSRSQPDPAAGKVALADVAPAPTADDDASDGKDEPKRRPLPKNTLTGAWHGGESKPPIVRPRLTSTVLSTRPRNAPIYGSRQVSRPQAVRPRPPSRHPRPIQPHAPPRSV